MFKTCVLKTTEKEVKSMYDKNGKNNTKFVHSVCFTDIRSMDSSDKTSIYLYMSFYEGIKNFTYRLNNMYENIQIKQIKKPASNQYIYKIRVSCKYSTFARKIVFYMVACMIRLLYTGNFRKPEPDTLKELDIDIINFIRLRDRECNIRDRLHSLYDGSLENFEDSVFLSLDNIKLMNKLARGLKSKRYFAQTEILNTLKRIDIKRRKNNE